MSKKEIDKHGGYVEFLDPLYSNATELQRIDWTTRLAAISRGKDKSANPKKRYAALMKEAEGSLPSRPFEFLPIKIPLGKFSEMGLHGDKLSRVSRFSITDNSYMYTNMRALIGAGVEYETIPFYEDTYEFAAFKIKAPMFVWAQIVTHTQLSTESQSDRVAEEQEYWLPDDIEEHLNRLNNDDSYMDTIVQKVYLDCIQLSDDIASGNIPITADGFKNYMVKVASQNDVQVLLKALGYPREIWSRAPYYFKMKEFVITGWINNDDAWPHFLRERNAYMNDGGPKNWTQPETQKYAYAIRGLLEEKRGATKEYILGSKDVIDD